MANITFHNEPAHTAGDLPKVGTVAPDFSAVKNDLAEVKLSDFKGKKVILNIFPSVDTGVCAASVRKFHVEASKLNNVAILCISKDLPFALTRFCTSKLNVTSQDFVTIEGKAMATEEDKQANENIMPFGQCKLKPTTGGYLPCMPAPVKWEQTVAKDTINDLKILTEKSTCQCAVGGKISVTHKGHNEHPPAGASL